MKRSEMLERLVFSIELHAGSDPSWLEHSIEVKQKAYEYANKILRDLEEEGMLPPQKEGEFCYDCGEAKDNLHWELEDEAQ